MANAPETSGIFIGPDAGPREEAETRALLRILAAQSENANSIVAIAAIALIYTMWNRVDPVGLIIWASLAVVMGVSRHLISRRVRVNSATADEARLRRYQRLMLAGTACNSVVMGSAFWLFAASAADVDTRMIVTLISMVHMVAVLLYLTPRFIDRLIGTAGNVGQGSLFWLGIGTDHAAHWEVLVVYVGLFWCGLVFGREQLRQFRESLRVRNENVALLAQLEKEGRAVQAALEEARRANASKSRFLAAASHDLRQPLHALTMFLGTLGFHVAGDDARRLLGRATDAVRALDEQFNSLLDMSRFDAGAVAVDSRNFRLDSLLHKVVDEFRPQADGKGLTLSVTAVPGLAFSDPLLLGRLLRNLIDNAIHYTPSGHVTVRMQRATEGYSVTVEDTGPGIAAEQQARIFDEYVQLDNPGRQRQHGVGLGLAIVKRISQLLDVQLRLNSQTGRGSRFSIVVPAAPAGSAEVLTGSAPIDVLAFRTTAHIWILDDDPAVLEGLQAQLHAWGASVVAFAEPQALLERLGRRGSQPDWILSDDMLGTSFSGLDLARHVARDYPQVHVCLVTGNTEPERLAELRDGGMPVIIKPATPERLIGLLAGTTLAPRAATTAA